MTESNKKEIGKIIDALVDSSVQLHHIELNIKSITNKVDGLSTKLYFQYLEEEKDKS